MGIKAVSSGGTTGLFHNQIIKAGVGNGVPAITVGYNFMAGVLDPALTFTRADSTTCATYYNSSGVLTTAAANVARFDYNPSTLSLNGLLMESSTTNLLYPSIPDAGTTWTYTHSAGTINSTTSPDGSANATLFVDDTSSNPHYAAPTTTVSFTSGTSYTLSVFFKAQSQTAIQLVFPSSAFGTTAYANFNLSNGSVGSLGAAATATIQQVANGFYRCTATAPATSTTTGAPTIGLTNSTPTAARLPTYTGVGNGVYVYGADIEALPFASSYVPTTSGTVTRAADNLNISSIPWYNSTAGSFSLEYYEPYTGALNPGANRGLAIVSDNTSNNRVQFYIGQSSTALSARITTASTSANPTFSGTENNPGINKAVIAYAVGNANVALNSTLGSSSSPASLPSQATLTQGFNLGCFPSGLGVGSSCLFGHLRNFKYWNTALTNTQLQSVTT